MQNSKSATFVYKQPKVGASCGHLQSFFFGTMVLDCTILKEMFTFCQIKVIFFRQIFFIFIKNMDEISKFGWKKCMNLIEKYFRAKRWMYEEIKCFTKF